MTANCACRAVPRVFQPQPEKTRLRSHSCATQTAARRKARRRLFVERNQGERLWGDSLATAEPVLATGRFRPTGGQGKGGSGGGCVQRFTGAGARTDGRNKPQIQLQSAK